MRAGLVPVVAASSRLCSVLTDLYDTTSCCPDLEAHAASRQVDTNELKLFERLAKLRHANPGQSRADALKSKEWKDLYQYISQELTGGLERGYGLQLVKTALGSPDRIMLAKLTENLHWFSANKNWQLLLDLNDQLTVNGKLREWADFKTEALKLNQQYSVVWLRTEYNAAVASAQVAAKWVEIEQDAADVYVRFDTAGDRRVRPAHQLLDGITLPADDKFWSSYSPPLDWGCRCTITTVLRSKAKPTDLQQKGPLPQIAKGFTSNVAKSGQVFDESHPYFQDVPKADQKTLRDIVQDVTPAPKQK